MGSWDGARIVSGEEAHKGRKREVKESE